MNKNVNGISISCIKGNIADQKGIEVIVNAANAELVMGGGVAGAIHKAAGPGLSKECSAYAPIKPGEAVITSGHNLPNKYVIHCLGPIYGKDNPSDKLLADCYRNALRTADEKKIESIAFPAISTGVFGYPMEDAAKISFKAIKQMIPDLKHIKLIEFVLYNDSYLKIHEGALNEVFN